MKQSLSFIALIILIAGAVPASSQQVAAINYLGFAWEDGGIPPSDFGDLLYFTGVATTADPLFEVDLAVDELTFYMYDLQSIGQVDLGDGTLLIQYIGGWLDVHRDPQKNAAWGINPPNAVSPSTFLDGSLFFRGPFIDLTVVLYTDGSGEYIGNLNGEEGEILEMACEGCVFTFGGTFRRDAGAQIPEGYDLQVVGTLEVDAAVATDQTSWGRVKALFN